MIGVLITVVLPVFIVIGAGYAASRSGIVSSSVVDGLMFYTQTFGIPCLLFRAIATLDLGATFDPRLLLSFYTGALVCFLLAVLGARRIFRRTPGESVAIGFSALFSNAVLLGLPIMERAYGPASLAPNFAIISVHAPFCYLLGISAMEFVRSDGRGFSGTLQAVARAMFRNAMMIALALGFLVNLAGVPLHETIWSAVDMLADSALPVALFALGGVLTRYPMRASLGEAGMISVLSLVLHPGIAYVLSALVFDLPNDFVRGAVVAAAMAPGVNTYVFANMYGRARAQAASSVLVATGLSVISVSVWLAILGALPPQQG